MATLDKRYQAFVKDTSSIPLGVMQIRASLPSVRDAGAVSGTATVKAVQQVPNTTVDVVIGTDGSTNVSVVRPGTLLPTADIKVNTFVSSGTYTYGIDGCFVIRYNGTTYDIYAPDGYKDVGVAAAAITAGYTMKVAGGTTCGATLTGTVTTPANGTTFIVPVFSSAAQSNVQSLIVSPYSPFFTDTNSLGKLTSSSFAPKVEDSKTLTAGFPEVEVDRIVTRTSVTISFEAQEYTNTIMGYLKSMVNNLINKATTSSIAIEAVMRTRGNDLITFYCPTCSLENVPAIAPTNDFSSFQWSFTANKMTEITSHPVLSGSALVVFNTWLRETPVYFESQYVH